MDLPGYGYAKVGGKELEKLRNLIFWYLFESGANPKVVLLIDSIVGPTEGDIDMLHALESAGREIVIVLNKVDKIKPSQYHKQMKKLTEHLPGHTLIPYSSKSGVGVKELSAELLQETVIRE